MNIHIKRLLIIGMLLVMAAVLVAADPPVDNPDSPDAPDVNPVVIELPSGDPQAAAGHGCAGDITDGPELVGMDVQATALFYCWGAIRKVRYELWLQRHVWWFRWETLDSHDTGWKTETSLLKTLYGACTEGEHTYRMKVKISAVDWLGKTNTLTGRKSARLEC